MNMFIKIRWLVFIVMMMLVLLLLLFRSEQGALLFEALSGAGKHTTPVVTLHADEKGHFFGNLNINGISLKYIVDSGASNVTLNSDDARRAKIDYSKGQVVGLITPAGEVKAFSLKLNGVMIGQAVIDDVEATIVEGPAPPYVLLGISAQRKLDVKRDNGIMTLGERVE